MSTGGCDRISTRFQSLKPHQYNSKCQNSGLKEGMVKHVLKQWLTQILLEHLCERQ
jgi:hypothetical protein